MPGELCAGFVAEAERNAVTEGLPVFQSHKKTRGKTGQNLMILTEVSYGKTFKNLDLLIFFVKL